MHSSRASVVGGQLRRLVRSAEMVGEFEGFLRKHGVDERLEVVAGPDGEPVLYFSHNRRVPFAQACSSGTLTLLQLFARFRMGGTGENPSLVFIDEFDAYLHYEVAERLIRWFASIGTCQTICTTHNTSLVRNATMRPDCVFEITREASSVGSIPRLLIRPLADRTEREIRRVNNVEHLLRSGEFD
jgi:predicted ATPase